MARVGTYPKGVAKREEILAVGLDVVAENGCRRTTVREIARRVGLTTTGLLHYFDSREQLFEEILSARDARDQALVDQRQPRPIDGYLRLLTHNTTVPGLVQLFAEYSAEAAGYAKHPSHRFFIDRYARLRRELTQIVRAGIDAGEVDEAIDVETVVNLLLAAADGLQVQWMLDPGIDMAAHVDRLWGLLAPRP